MRIQLILFFLLVFPAFAWAEDENKPLGLILHDKEAAFEGYNLFAPLDSATTYLMDNEGRVIHTWESEYRPGSVPYLLENGNLLRPASYGRGGNRVFAGGGAGYRIEEWSWDGEKLWEFVYASDERLMHHDIAPMPNGNVLVLAWEMKTKEEAKAAGRKPDLMRTDELWPEHIIEVKPTRPEGGEIVWEWHLWDHLIQDYDETKANYGDVAAHPELVDINPTGHWLDVISDEELAKLDALGYLADNPPQDTGKKPRRGGIGADWLHANAIAYNAELNQIAISLLGNNEIWIVDHSTTTEEAKGHAGGRAGMGGDILYRWGNPIAYRAAGEYDQQLFAQHDVHWIAKGLPGEGNLLLFNNGRGREEGNYSSVEELVPPLKDDYSYALAPGEPFAPEGPVWEYSAPETKEFYSSYISGARRLPNGNTLICQGADGTFFEVTPDKQVVWKYVNPAVPPDIPKDEEGKGGKTYNNPVFRLYRYAPDYPAFEDKDLSPGPVLVEYLENHPAKRPREFNDDHGSGG